MHQFKVPDMSCGHCVSTITETVKTVDPKAKIEISLADRLVKVESSLSQNKLVEQIREAGYTPTAL
jgi:copper chaperone